MNDDNKTFKTPRGKRSDWAEIVQWLQENVGELLWSHPIIQWHGQGWHLKSGSLVQPRGRGTTIETFYEITIDDEQKRLLAILRWQ